MKWTIYVLMIVVAVSGAAGDEEPTIVAAEIYYYGWEALHRTEFTPKDVRRLSRVTTKVLDPHRATALFKWVTAPAMTANSTTGDARLVLDFTTSGGLRITYYASRDTLYSEDSRLARPIEADFRDRFRSFGEEGSHGL